MSAWALFLAACLYIVTAGDLFSKGKAGLGLAFLFYAAANVGFIVAVCRGE